MAPHAPLQPLKPTQDTTREDSRQEHMFHFSQDLWGMWKMWCGCHPLTPFTSCHPIQCLLETQSDVLYPGEFRKWLLAEVHLGYPTQPLWDFQLWKSGITGNMKGSHLSAVSINQGSSGSTFLFALERVTSLWCEGDKGQAEQTQDLMVLVLVERLPAHTSPSPINTVDIIHQLKKWELCTGRHRPPLGSPAWARCSLSSVERQGTPPHFPKDELLHCTTGRTWWTNMHLPVLEA